MTQKLGLNTDSLELSDSITRPFDLTDVKPQTTKTMAELGKETKVSDEWTAFKLDKQDMNKAREMWTTFRRGVEDEIINIPADLAITAGTAIEEPVATGTAITGFAAGAAVGTQLVKKATTNKIASFFGGLVGGSLGANVLVSAFMPTELGSDDTMHYIPEENIIASNKDLKEYAETVGALKDKEFPVEDIAQDMIRWGAKSKEARQTWRDYQAENEGIDQTKWTNQLAQGASSIVVPIAAGRIAFKAATAGKAKQIQNAVTGKTEKVLSNKARKEAAETATTAMKTYTTAQMTADYVSGDVEDYINKTGDASLAGFEIDSPKAAAAYSYGMLGNMIEYDLGGVENVVAGAWKKAGLSLKMGTGKALVTVAAEEGAEEGLQSITEFMSRKVNNTTDQTWGEAIKDALQSSMYGAIIGGPVGAVAHRTGRRNLAKAYQNMRPGMSYQEALQMADETIENSAKALAPENEDIRNLVRKNVEAYYADNEDVDDYDKDVATDEIMQNLQQKATRDGVTLKELPEINNAVVDQLAWWINGRPGSVAEDVEKIIDDRKKATERVAELEQKQDRTDREIEELDMLQERLDKATDLSENLQELIKINKKAIAVRKIQEDLQKEQQAQEKREQKAKDRETARVVSEQAAKLRREQRKQERADEIEKNVAIDLATESSLRQALINGNPTKRTIIERLTSRGLRRYAKNRGVDLEALRIKTADEIEQELQEKEAVRKEKEEIARTGRTTARKLLWGRINLEFAKASGIYEAWGLSTEDRHNNANFMFDTKGGIADWDAVVQALAQDGYMTATYETTYAGTDAQESQAKNIVLSNKIIEKLDSTPAETTFTDAQIEWLRFEGANMLRNSGKFTPEQLKEIAKSPEAINQALNEILPTSEEIEMEETIADEDIPDDLPFFQESFDVADENARLDEIYPEYTRETINIDGKERSVYNSNGERIAKSAEALRNFYKWFGDSKVVDEQGRPLVVYHGTNAEFDTFEKDRIGDFGKGYYFTTSRENAEQYATRKGGNIVMPVYLSIKNIYEAPGNAGQFLYNLRDKKTSAKQAQGVLLEEGFGGIEIKQFSGKEKYFVAFEPNQIKSVNNRGTYDIENPNIYYQSAYAGSRVDYDRPSLEAIGSGEGAAAHGWGLYYALDKNIAERYRYAFTQSESNKYKEEELNDLYTSLIDKQEYGKATIIESLLIRHTDEDIDDMLAEGAITQKDVDWFRSIEDKYLDKTKKEGQVHEVDIPEMNYLLDEQKGFSEQPEFVQEKVKETLNDLGIKKIQNIDIDSKSNFIASVKQKLGQEAADIMSDIYDLEIKYKDSSDNTEELDAAWNRWNEFEKNHDTKGFDPNIVYSFQHITGEAIYDALVEKLGTAKEASQILEKHGIKGITYEGGMDGRCFVIFNPKDVKVLRKKFDELGNVLFQDKLGKGKRGAYFPELDAIARLNNADATTLLHEFAHYFFEDNMRKYNAGGGSEQWRTAWKKVIDSLGVPENAGPKQWRQASETFARGYEAWLMETKKRQKVAADDEKDPLEESYQMFQEHMRDIYTALSNPYFKDVWGDTATQMKPELAAWFDRVTDTATLQGKVVRGEITEGEAKVITEMQNVAAVVKEREDVQEKIDNDTNRYEVEGGNVNRTVARLQEIAKEIDSVNADIKGNKYDTRRDMLQVARDADAFVKTRREEAMAIINGTAPEVEGLYREDLFTAMKRLAQDEGDIDLLKELATSPIAQGIAKQLGQRIVAFRNFQADGDINISSVLNTLETEFEKSYNTEKGKQETETLAQEYESEVNTQDKLSDAQLDEILQEMECK